MSTEHYTHLLSAFVDQELEREDRQKIAEHLIACESCRKEHDELKFGASLGRLAASESAPDRLWESIENDLDGRKAPALSVFEPRRISFKNVFAAACAIVVVGLLSFAVYRGLFTGEKNLQAGSPNTNEAVPVPPGRSTEIAAGNVNAVNANSAEKPTALDKPSWQVETIAGTGSPETLAVGDYLETDKASRVRIEVANIGNVEIAPNSRVKLVGTTETEHRLSLERGSLHAKIFAPPRLFVVDTPSGKAVDLGCEYTLDVDRKGDSILKVTGGYVALEQGGRESIVPAGAMCVTRKGKGLGTPLSLEATPEFAAALERFDFGGGGSKAVAEVINLADLYDVVTLWHLISRVRPSDRAMVADALARFVPLPKGTDRDAVLSLQKQALENWRAAVEDEWFNN